MPGLPWWLSGKESVCQCRSCGFDHWVARFPWRRKWEPTPVLLPGESHGRRSLVGCSLWGHKGLDSTERLNINNNCDARGGELRALVLLWPLSVRNQAYMPCGAFHAPALPHLMLVEGASWPRQTYRAGVPCEMNAESLLGSFSPNDDILLFWCVLKQRQIRIFPWEMCWLGKEGITTACAAVCIQQRQI